MNIFESCKIKYEQVPIIFNSLSRKKPNLNINAVADSSNHGKNSTDRQLHFLHFCMSLTKATSCNKTSSS